MERMQKVAYIQVTAVPLETKGNRLTTCMMAVKREHGPRTVWHGLECDLSVGILEKQCPRECFATETDRGRFVAVKFTNL